MTRGFTHELLLAFVVGVLGDDCAGHRDVFLIGNGVDGEELDRFVGLKFALAFSFWAGHRQHGLVSYLMIQQSSCNQSPLPPLSKGMKGDFGCANHSRRVATTQSSKFQICVFAIAL